MTFELHRTLMWYIFVCFIIIKEDLISSFAGYFKNSIIVIVGYFKNSIIVINIIYVGLAINFKEFIFNFNYN